MLRPIPFIRLLSALGLVLAGLVAMHHPAQTSAQAAGQGGVTVLSVVPDDPTDARFQVPYTYLINAGTRDGVTAAASGSETYQAYDGESGEILATKAIGADGSAELVYPYATANGRRDVHVININDTGDGSDSVTVDDTITVVVNTGAGSGAAPTDAPTTEPTTTPPPPTATPRTPRPTSTATMAATTAPSSAPSGSTGGQNGMRAAIYAGNCDSDFSGDPVATLSDVAAPDGTPRGAGAATVVALSSSTIDATFDTLLNDDHVLVVFGNDDKPVACGAIGGVIRGDGSLVFGLSPVGDSGYTGVAYLLEDNGKIQVALFLTQGGTPQATPSA